MKVITFSSCKRVRLCNVSDESDLDERGISPEIVEAAKVAALTLLLGKKYMNLYISWYES